MLVAFVTPRAGFGLICAALVLHLKPDVSDIRPGRIQYSFRHCLGLCRRRLSIESGLGP